jgi:hypothetical protein
MKKLLLALAFLPVTLFAQSAFDGTWKSNLQSTNYQGKDTFSLQNGVYRCTSCIPKIEVKADGQDHKVSSPYYDTMSVRVVDDHTIESITKKAGKETGKTKETVSADGKMLHTDFSFVSDNGQPGNGSYNSHRLEDGPKGAHLISGVWQPEKLESASDSVRTIIYKSAADGMSMSDQVGDSYTAKFDGKDYPYKGDPGISTVSLKKIDDHAFQETYKLKGKALFVITLTAAADGKTFASKLEDKRRDVVITATWDKQ